MSLSDDKTKFSSVENRTRPDCLSKARFYISFDFELGWGVIANQRWKERQRQGIYSELRAVLPLVLDILESREINGDWATVGAMASSVTSGDFEHLPESYLKLVKSFLKEAQSSTVDGRDLVDLVADTRNQRIISHGYSHIVLDRVDLPIDSLHEELTRNHALLAKWGGSGEIMVFPENRVPEASRMVGTNIQLARVAPQYSVIPAQRLLQKAFYPPASVSSNRNEKFAFRTGSLLFKPRSRRLADRQLFILQRKSVIRRLASGLDQCLWVHPFNFVEFPDLTSHLKILLDEVNKLRNAGIVDSCALN